MAYRFRALRVRVMVGYVWRPGPVGLPNIKRRVASADFSIRPPQALR